MRARSPDRRPGMASTWSVLLLDTGTKALQVGRGHRVRSTWSVSLRDASTDALQVPSEGVRPWPPLGSAGRARRTDSAAGDEPGQPRERVRRGAVGRALAPVGGAVQA